MSDSQRFIWQTTHIVDVRDAVFAARTYLEHRDLRLILNNALGNQTVGRACEIGSGFGRMTPVLTEFAAAVFGFEREPHFVREAQALHPTISFREVPKLDALPAPDHFFSLALTFTVLQHLVDSVVGSVATEIQRVLGPDGLLVLCEETDTTHVDGTTTDPNGVCTIGRSVTSYEALFPECTLLTTRPRVIEPTYPRADVGTYMLFKKSKSALKTE